jgi:hypothetical protein
LGQPDSSTYNSNMHSIELLRYPVIARIFLSSIQ